ncbi:MAG: hypothetical protein WD794_04410 [Mycobacteriales bacterium]
MNGPVLGYVLDAEAVRDQLYGVLAACTDSTGLSSVAAGPVLRRH